VPTPAAQVPIVEKHETQMNTSQVTTVEQMNQQNTINPDRQDCTYSRCYRRTTTQVYLLHNVAIFEGSYEGNWNETIVIQEALCVWGQDWIEPLNI
jgi:hypothetical protein